MAIVMNSTTHEPGTAMARLSSSERSWEHARESGSKFKVQTNVDRLRELQSRGILKSQWEAFPRLIWFDHQQLLFNKAQVRMTLCCQDFLQATLIDILPDAFGGKLYSGKDVTTRHSTPNNTSH
ncbi:hypothetical protein CEXT_674561 [Caerostris extrusa]|uniref:Uncharacterized protein n=1 Tax=Caerostris extrusa TaxID=172846 RepID=A0AAV4S4L7_CAEEX|nr:hypothetical protein CEXT_674561 [Caerostris extrusa]